VVLAASHGGAVVLDEDGPQWDAVFGAGQPTRGGLIRPDPARLDLKARDVIRLGRLDVADSGRIVGPKAANLGSLKRHFPEAVADGLVLPFGVFRAVLERPIEPGGPSAIEWMAAQYAALAGLPEGSERRRSATAAYLARVREFILAQQLGPEMRARLRAALDDTFGADGSYGVFVRSDTNVEDLPGFTGAGLNLTVPNVVGSEQILAAIPRVWASPFTDRAFSWRQARMTNPEDVYVSVLLQHSVPVEKSGVLVTVDVDSGRRGVLSVAVNEGVGGAVDNQAAEDLRIDLQHGGVRLMAEATAPRKRVLDPNGGMAEVPTGIVDAVLSDAEIGQLRRWVSRLPEVLPTARDGDGALRALDIEFGFLDGRFYLFQLRPFVDSKGAAHSLFLQRLDQSMVADDEMPVDLQARP
jgi:phosphoenolpyruvate synthase/pyruvate phosphate dikinase